MKFTQIPAALKYPPTVRSVLSTYHSSIISWAIENYSGTFKERRDIVTALNTISYYVISGDTIPDNWSMTAPLVNMPNVSENELKPVLKSLYVEDRTLDWDITAHSDDNKTVSVPVHRVINPNNTAKPSNKSDLYIQSPEIPMFDKQNPIVISKDDNDLIIYPSLPIVPTCQNEISATTDVSKLTDSDLLKLFPSEFIQTRPEVMYTKHENLDYHPDLGVIFPILDFTYDQIVENIIKYPHLYKLRKEVNGRLSNFYKTVEIDGELHSIVKVWDQLSDCKHIPNSLDFMKEYVVRRYLLERDILHVEHKYKLYGELDAFLTLFAPPDMYDSWGYVDSVSLARQCVNARVAYKRSRNPILRRQEKYA